VVRTAILGGALLVLGGLAVAFGALSVRSAAELGVRVWPILLFVIAITVVTELAAAAGLFAVIAERLARWGFGRAWVLWLLVVILSTLSTIFLSLDTTAVLLTPVVVTVARSVGLPPMPFALTTVWLANSGSLLLPVSNLTNLLAVDRISPNSPGGFAALMVAPAIVATVVPAVVVFLIYRRPLLERYELVARTQPEDRVLLLASAVVIVAILPVLVSGVPVWIPAVLGSLILLALFLVRRRDAIHFSLIPWPLVLFACGLFLVIAAATSNGLAEVLATVAGRGDSLPDLLRLAGVGVVSSNAVNNLPSYLALESTAGSPVRIAALLIGVDAGPLITPWASLATLLWGARLAGLGVWVSWLRFAALGTLVVPLTVVLAVFALYLET
jgi:Na+/H+ antiporter NhaD/arsenite permease-like protein